MRAPSTRILVFLLALLALAAIAEPTLSLRDPVSRNYNEGWNALHATNVLEGRSLYPDSDARHFNNYPPLSFLITAALGSLGADVLVVGRVIALLSLAVVAASMGAIAWTVSACRAIGAFVGVLIVAVMGLHFPQYVGMNDPQMLAHALQILGLAVFVARIDDARARTGGFVLVVLGGTVKHSLVAIPIAMVLWMVLNRRREAGAFAGVALVVVAAGTAALALGFGRPLFDGVFGHARAVELHRLPAAVANWLIPVAPLLGAAVVGTLARTRDSRVDLLTLIAGVGLFVGLSFAPGGGVNYNVVFDAIFACAALAGLAAQIVADGWASTRLGVDLRRALAMLVVASSLVFVAPSRLTSAWNDLQTRTARVEQARADVAFVRAQPEPALCATLALAHWAGRGFEVDVFNFSQAVRVGAREESTLIDPIRRGAFGLIQLRDYDREVHFTPAMLQAIEASYRRVRTSPVYGDFYLPRAR